MSDVAFSDREKALEIVDKSHHLIRDLLNGSPDEDSLLIGEEFLNVYREHHLTLIEIRDRRFSRLRDEIGRYYSDPNYHTRLVDNGLTGTELDFKYKIFNITYNKIYSNEEEGETNENKNNNEPDNKENNNNKPRWYNRVWDKVKSIKKLPGKVLDKASDYIDDIKDGLGAVNTVLGSFGIAGLPTGAIDEIKEFVTRILKRRKDKQTTVT
jgi:hypothetical protein